ncbi:hypothetical protein [Cylindrospermum sp. FACHB-282]|uniref:hypothetical protein n=1 Tax=Cylindrospermum sp. FACHB-282 TaxID=2692794 RepID=UPI001684AB78|nr:hypothetical protein [Cylindrospermum sp. FACHB-282]MBD2386851.1 hypothetical protein [Cylindrospermum sp. FACHB-282]
MCDRTKAAVCKITFLKGLIKAMDYLGGRQNPIPEVPIRELNKMLAVLVSEFDAGWLRSGYTNPVQKLWQRMDYLSTCELLLLGNALKKLKPIDPHWVSAQVKLIKQEDKNNRRGALFELLALSLFDGEGVSVRPAASSNPGYDGTVLLPRNASIQVSVKSYGTSSHQEVFNNQCSMIEALLTAALSKRQLNAVGIYVFAKSYPTQSDWEVLKRRLPAMLDSVENRTNDSFEDIQNSCWDIIINNLHIENCQFSPIHKSYTFIVCSPYHKNEYKNLYSKLDDAYVNFTRHAGSVDPLTTRMVFIDIPTSASITLCKEWAKQYFQLEQQGASHLPAREVTRGIARQKRNVP